MSLKIETLENSMAKLTIEVDSAEFDKAIAKAYQKNKGSIALPGFRKGKVPQAMVEKMYGPAVFYEDAANFIIPEAYEKALEECDLEITSRPEIDVEQIEKGKNFIFTATVAIKPEVKLGTYKKVKVKKADTEVTDADVEEALKRELEAQARMVNVEDRAVVDGDMTTIDYEGSVDGVPFDGGKAEEYPLTIGSHSFIPGFEEQIIGMNIGEEKDINVTFPEEYHAPELAGKAAVFKVKLHAIKAKELPVADDEFAQEVSEFDTLDEYKEDLKKTIQTRKENQAKAEKEDAVIEKIIEKATIDLPEPMVNDQVENMINDMAARMQQQGLNMEQYMQLTGMDINKLKEQMQPQAVKRLKSRLVLEAIAEKEKLEVTDERFDEEISNMASMYQMEADKLKELIGENEKNQIKKDIAVQMAVDFVREAAVEA